MCVCVCVCVCVRERERELMENAGGSVALTLTRDMFVFSEQTMFVKRFMQTSVLLSCCVDTSSSVHPANSSLHSDKVCPFYPPTETCTAASTF